MQVSTPVSGGKHVCNSSLSQNSTLLALAAGGEGGGLLPLSLTGQLLAARSERLRSMPRPRAALSLRPRAASAGGASRLPPA